MHRHFARKIGSCRLFKAERRKVHSYMVPYIILLMLMLCGYYIYDSIKDNTKKTPNYEVSSKFHTRILLNTSGSEYPEDLFTQEQRRHGAVILHIVGLCYLFLAVALACDEFFVPSLEVIIDRLNISEDVAGATFMAAGGSAPELFISLFGTFADPKSNVGIGTIVGSAVFNVLFVIGMCAMFSKQVLTLTWWPLFRDCIFYSVAILLLIVFFLDENIFWYEALALFIMYLLYVTFMKFNHTFERIVKNSLRSNKVSKVSSDKDVDANNPGVRTEHYLEKAMEYLSSSNNKTPSDKPCFHYGALQLVVNTIDPLWDASLAVRVKHFKQMSKNVHHVHMNKLDEQKHSSLDLQKRPSEHSTQLSINTMTNGTVQTDCNSTSTRERGQSVLVYDDKDLGIGSSVNEYMSTTVEIVPLPAPPPESPIPGMCIENNNDRKISTESRQSMIMVATASSQNELVPDAADMDEIEDTEPIDLSWPDGHKERIAYIIKAPVMFLMYYTMFDVRRPEKARFYPWTFFMSTIWIGAYAYLLVWWAKVAGDTFGIPTSVMGLTFLAAGTSIPDLITSVLVARKGFGDMAVSSSIGSNMFDITVGLPVPWMAYCGIYVVKKVVVNRDGLFCSVIMLFLMLVSVVTSIALSKWRMSKLLGATMFLLYIVFIILSLLLQFNIIKCFEISI